MAQIKTARMSNSTIGSSIDDEVGNLEDDIATIFGIPQDTTITNALLEVVAGGLKTIILQDAAADPATAGHIRRNSARLKFYNGTRAEDLVCLNGGNTNKVLFNQASAPTGWTRVVDAGNTESIPMLRLNSEVPGTGGSWTISGLTASGTALTLAKLPSSHYYGTADNNGAGGGGGGFLTGADQGGGETHDHTVSSAGTWRPKYTDIICCSKD